MVLIRCGPRGAAGALPHGALRRRYTTNLPLEDLLGGKGLVATRFDGEPLAPEHGGPARLLVPHLYFWKSAKWVRRLGFMEHDEPGFWESLGYHIYGDPWREQRYDGD
jgi:DMSO/TMAO reductase YedYZ molybdopterin-dependent catalytic subunit